MNFHLHIYLLTNTGFYNSDLNYTDLIPEALPRTVASDGTKRVISINFVSSSTYNISFGSWSDSAWSRTIDWYSFKIWNGNTILRNFIPCYRRADNIVGMYDMVENQFYTNSGTGVFVAGPEK